MIRIKSFVTERAVDFIIIIMEICKVPTLKAILEEDLRRQCY